MYGINIKKGINKFQTDIYFNKRKRRLIKINLLKIQKSILEGQDFSEKPVVKKDFEEREYKTVMLGLSVKGLNLIKDAEELDKDKLFTNCKFELYKLLNIYVFKATFFKPLKRENKTSFLILKNGLPNKFKKKGYIEKINYELFGYEIIDKGTFKQKFKNFQEIELSFKGNKLKFNFLLKLINKEKGFYWVSLR